MAEVDPRRDRRVTRRVKMGCKAKIRVPASGETFYGECVDLSVDGLAVRSNFVPRFGERVDVVLMVAGIGGQPARPLALHAEVRRCNEWVSGYLYDIGLRIVSREP